MLLAYWLYGTLHFLLGPKIYTDHRGLILWVWHCFLVNLLFAVRAAHSAIRDMEFHSKTPHGAFFSIFSDQSIHSTDASAQFWVWKRNLRWTFYLASTFRQSASPKSRMAFQKPMVPLSWLPVSLSLYVLSCPCNRSPVWPPPLWLNFLSYSYKQDLGQTLEDWTYFGDLVIDPH